jgi:hypothetical protein
MRLFAVVRAQALANIFRPKGVLLPSLVLALAEAWPEAQAGEIEKLAQRWLKARHDPAHSTADGLAPKGELYLEAMRRAEELHARRTQAPAAGNDLSMVSVDAVPAVTVNAPAAPTQKLAVPQASLMMDTI